MNPLKLKFVLSMLICFMALNSLKVFGGELSLEKNYFQHQKQKEKEEKKKFCRFHTTTEVGLSVNNLSDAMTTAFANDLYQGAVNYIPGVIQEISGLPDQTEQPVVFNFSFDFSISQRLKIGVGVNGIPKVQVVGYVDLDSINQYSQYYANKAEEIIEGTVVKLQLIYDLKKYHGKGLGWSLGLGAGITYNFVNLKQNFVTSVFDSTSQQYIQGTGIFEEKYSSVGGYALLRLDIYLGKHVSWATDVNALFSTNISIDETTYSYEEVQQSISKHNLNLNSWLIATGLSFHF